MVTSTSVIIGIGKQLLKGDYAVAVDGGKRSHRI
jgi:hypothetical protein